MRAMSLQFQGSFLHSIARYPINVQPRGDFYDKNASTLLCHDGLAFLIAIRSIAILLGI